MNSQLLKRKEFKQDVDKKLWKSYVKFPWVLMVKNSGDQRYQIYDNPYMTLKRFFSIQSASIFASNNNVKFPYFTPFGKL